MARSRCWSIAIVSASVKQHRSRDHGRWSFRVLWNRRKRDMIDQRQNQEICYYRRFIDKGLFAIT